MVISIQGTAFDNTVISNTAISQKFTASDGKQYINIIQTDTVHPDLISIKRNNNATYNITSTGTLYDRILASRYNAALNAVAKYNAEFGTSPKLSAIDLVRFSLMESGNNTNVMSINGGKGDYQLTDEQLEQIFNITGLNIDPWDSLQSAWGVLILLDDVAKYLDMTALTSANYTMKNSDWYMGYNIGASNLWIVLSNVISNSATVVSTSILNSGDALALVANNTNATYPVLQQSYNAYFNYSVGSDLL